MNGTGPDISPIPYREGGSRYGSHFFNLYRKCNMKWFNTFHRLHPDGTGVGLAPLHTSEPLMVGWLVHEGLAAWYASGWRDGNYSLGVALGLIDEGAEKRKDEFPSPEEFDEWIVKSRVLLTKYHDFYGPGGSNPEWPAVKILDDGFGAPLIERSLTAPLGYKDYEFTGRLDAICTYNGSVWSLEHKTSAASRVSTLFQSMGINSQATGQLYLLRHNFPDLDISGVLINVLVKNAGQARGKVAAKPNCVRNTTTRRPVDFEKFRRDIVKTIVAMEESLVEYEDLIDEDTANLDLDDAARLTFEMNTQHCVEFGNCLFYPMCKSLGHETVMAKPLRARAALPVSKETTS